MQSLFSPLSSSIDPAWRLLLNYLLLTATLMSVVFIFVYQFLFGQGLFSFAGGWQGLKLIFLVDLSLTVLLLAAVFKPRKALLVLKKDLMLVATVQLSILAVGVFMLYWARPLVVVYVFDEFHVLSSENYSNADIEVPPLSQFKGSNPKFLWVKTEDVKSAFIGGEILDMLNGKLPAKLDAERYQNFPDSASELREIINIDEAGNDGCVQVKVSSNFDVGSVCFLWREQEFRGFKPAS